MRKMLNQKESNYNRLRRAKMDKSMFVKIKTLGIGAFGEVCLTRKVDTCALYAMKTLRKKDVLNRNQVSAAVLLTHHVHVRTGANTCPVFRWPT